MALSNEDYLELLRHVQTVVRQYEPDLFDPLSGIRQKDIQPKQLVLRYLSSLIGAISQRSAGTYPRVLRLLNEHITPIEGRQITGIKVSLSPQERELYRLDEVNLSEIPERDELIAELHRIYELIESESSDERTNLR